MRWRVESETGRLTDVLLCRPVHYCWVDTNAVIHATLATGAVLDHAGLQAQYRELEAALTEAGVALHYTVPEPHLPYQVYTRDSSQTTPWGPVLTQLAMPQRRSEYASVLEFHAPYGGFHKYASAGTLEGGDIHIIRPGLLVVGYSGVRTNEAGARQFAGFFSTQDWEVRLVHFPAHFLHLDVLFCMATPHLAVACVDVLGEEFCTFLAERKIKCIRASYSEVMALSCNLLALGDGRVISPAHSKRINAALRAEGIVVLDPALEQFARGGGSAHCLTMPLSRAPV
ncbi:dimethylarginine dimethylaminohydrolase family protein [Acidocella sp.]|uniref:dimethylarginine dimethylaminohydrolase family protein n=1 Tax=Acidocella sp. TaxID=50710 RepID=UPI002F3FE3F4